MHCKLNISIQCPWTQLTISMDSVDNIHGLSGQCPWTMWTISMDIVQSTRSNTPAGQCPWNISTESMDFLQTDKVGCKACKLA